MSILPKGKQWLRHQGQRERARRLWQQLHREIGPSFVSEEGQQALKALRNATADDPDPESAIINLAQGALEGARITGSSWVASVRAMLLAFELKTQTESNADGAVV